MSDLFPSDDRVERRSLREESLREANDFRWFESERAGCDQGESAIRRWVHRHWPGFLRARWIEHMQGQRFWIELDRREFGILNSEFGDARPLLDQIIERLRCGAENLDILCWSRQEKSLQDQAKIRELLFLINVNAHRMRCYFCDDH